MIELNENKNWTDKAGGNFLRLLFFSLLGISREAENSLLKLLPYISP